MSKQKSNQKFINILTRIRGISLRLNKIKDFITRFKHKKQIDYMWELKPKDEIPKDLGDIYSKNIIWVQLGNSSMTPYYYVEEEGKKFTKLPYLELDMGLYLKDGSIIFNRFINVKN